MHKARMFLVIFFLAVGETERNVLRRILRPTKDRDGTWRLKTNDELKTLITNKNVRGASRK